MRLYIDSGKVSDVKEAARLGLIDGITTNPSLIAKEGKEFHWTLKEMIKVMRSHNLTFTISAEVTHTHDADEMIKQGKELAGLDPHILVKIPLTKEGLRAVNQLSDDGVRCNVTLCFSANQALLAAKAGAHVVSPFIGRIDDQGGNGLELIREIRQIYDHYGFETQILAASIRSAEHVLECARIGSDIATMPLSIYEKLYHHELTDTGLEQFAADWQHYEETHKKKKGGKQ